MTSFARAALPALVLFAWAALAAPASAASFDCAKAKAAVELAICHDGILGELDATLAAEFRSALAQQQGQRQGLLERQRAWLRARDKRCRIEGGGGQAPEVSPYCLTGAYAERIAELESTAPERVLRFDGAWRADFPCRLSKEACNGGADEFALDLWSQGARLCGLHLATAHEGNRVDEAHGDAPSILGTIQGPTATVRFASSWGGAGHANLTRIGERLYWRFLDDDGGAHWLPAEAILTARPLSAGAKLRASCGGPN